MIWTTESLEDYSTLPDGWWTPSFQMLSRHSPSLTGRNLPRKTYCALKDMIHEYRVPISLGIANVGAYELIQVRPSAGLMSGTWETKDIIKEDQRRILDTMKRLENEKREGNIYAYEATQEYYAGFRTYIVMAIVVRSDVFPRYVVL